jgi:hypothetical protein
MNNKPSMFFIDDGQPHLQTLLWNQILSQNKLFLISLQTSSLLNPYIQNLNTVNNSSINSQNKCCSDPCQVTRQPEDLGTELSWLVSHNLRIPARGHIKQRTSSVGPGRAVVSLPLRMPTIYGVGDKQISNREVGKTGINVCCQENGYKIDWRASTQDDSRL